ncbi:MAG: sulfite exporter TauE/SafE family protein [Xanthobacteraceae bacterium]|nr:sulfite exporter TauE/SafE family protein [Xanthobacteraceae bacterium]
MDGLIERIVAFALAGLASGFASGLFGIGGGIVRVPIFVYLLPLVGIPHAVMMHVAVGTSIALVVPSAMASTRKQLALGNLDLRYFRTWAMGILAGVVIGLAVLRFVSTEALQVIFALFMLSVGIYEGFLTDHMAAKSAPQGPVKVALAAVIGFVAALTGTGGGTLTTPALQAFSVRLQTAIAIASATGLVTGTVATVGAILNGWHTPDLPSYSLGFVDLAIFAAMLPTILIATPLGVRTGHRLSQNWLRRVYTVLLFVIAFDLIRRLIV